MYKITRSQRLSFMGELTFSWVDRKLWGQRSCIRFLRRQGFVVDVLSCGGRNKNVISTPTENFLRYLRKYGLGNVEEHYAMVVSDPVSMAIGDPIYLWIDNNKTMAQSLSGFYVAVSKDGKLQDKDEKLGALMQRIGQRADVENLFVGMLP